MRKYLWYALAAATLGVLGIGAPALAHDPGGYGGGGYGMMGGYGYRGGPGYGPGMMYGYGGGYGPGMMYGYGPDGRSYRGGDAYRGKRLCWEQTGSDRDSGHYVPCRN